MKTREEITRLFKLNGCSISEYGADAGRDRGMIYTRNRAWDVNLFCSYTSALEYFIKENWLYRTELD